MQIPKIHNQELDRAVRKAVEIGFTLEMKSNTSGLLTWPGAQERVSFSTHAEEYRGVKNFIAQCERICGRELFPRPNSGKYRQNAHKQAFNPSIKSVEDTNWSFQVEWLVAEYKEKAMEVVVLSSAEMDHRDIRRMIKLIERLTQLEAVLVELHHPIPDVGLPVLTEEFTEYKNRIRFS